MEARQVGEHLYEVPGVRKPHVVDMLKRECDCPEFERDGDCPHIRMVERQTGWKRVRCDRER